LAEALPAGLAGMLAAGLLAGAAEVGAGALGVAVPPQPASSSTASVNG
jgi:hypothetical protein